MNAELRLQCLRNLTDLLSRTFKGLFVFPVLGHDDTVNFSQLAELWSTWLPQEALDTLKSGTYPSNRFPRKRGGFLFLFLVFAAWERVSMNYHSSNIDRTFPLPLILRSSHFTPPTRKNINIRYKSLLFLQSCNKIHPWIRSWEFNKNFSDEEYYPDR